MKYHYQSGDMNEHIHCNIINGLRRKKGLGRAFHKREKKEENNKPQSINNRKGLIKSSILRRVNHYLCIKLYMEKTQKRQSKVNLKNNTKIKENRNKDNMKLQMFGLMFGCLFEPFLDECKF